MAKIMRLVMAFALCVVSVTSRSVHRRKPREVQIVQKQSASCQKAAKESFCAETEYFSGIASEREVSYFSKLVSSFKYFLQIFIWFSSNYETRLFQIPKKAAE